MAMRGSAVDVVRVETADDAVPEGARLGDGVWEVPLAGRSPEELLAALVTAGVRVRSFQRVEATLEDIFLSVVHGEPELPKS